MCKMNHVLLTLFAILLLQARCVYKSNGHDPVDAVVEAEEPLEEHDLASEDLAADDTIEAADDSYETECLLYDWIEYDVADDCPRYCGSDCEDLAVECGFQCCSWGMIRKCFPCYIIDFEGNNVCDITMRWGISPVTRENKYFLPVLRGYNYKGDGSEVAVWGSWVEHWNEFGCINHCYESGYFLYVIDINLEILVHGERVPDVDFPWEYFVEFNGECPIACGSDSCIFYCSRFDLLETDRTYWLDRYTFYYSAVASPPIDRLSELPALKDAVHIYRTSTWELMGTVDLLLLHQDEVYHVE